MWKYAGPQMRAWKIPERGSWASDNQMGGVMWATPTEYAKRPISGKQLARVLEIAFDTKKCPVTQLRQMRKTCSYIYSLATGKQGQNFDDVDAMFKSFDLKECGPPLRSVAPTKVASPNQLKRAWDTEWSRSLGESLVDFMTALVCLWDWAVLGNRPSCDIDKIKNSKTSVFSFFSLD